MISLDCICVFEWIGLNEFYLLQSIIPYLAQRMF